MTHGKATYIAVDLGGTNIRAAHYVSDGTLLARAKHPTLPEGDGGRTPPSVVARIFDAIREVMPADKTSVRAISIGAPGPVNPYTGIVLRAANIPGWVDIPLKREVESCFGLPAEIGNDANLAAMGEWKFGAGRGHNDVLYLTISTGIGGGVISHGQLIVGAEGMAAELGHVAVVPNGPVCGCGQRGHLEALASGPAIAHTAQAQLRSGEFQSTILIHTDGDIETVTAQHVGLAAKAGDAYAINLLAEAGTFIGHALADFLCIFNPSIVILGGGVASNVGELLLAPVRQAMRQRAMSEIYYHNLSVVPAQLGDDVGLLGALALAVETHPA
jgi:glucokinase